MAERWVYGCISKSFPGFVTILGLSILLGCGPATKKVPTEKLVADAGFSTISATSNILANGTAVSTISIVLKDQKNSPMAGIVPFLQVSGTGNTLGSCSSSDAGGASTCELKSTKAETKTIAMLLPTQISTTVTFVPGAATKLGFAVQPSGGTANDVWVDSPRVEVWDANNNLVSSGSATITLALQAGSGTLSGTLTRATTGGQALFSGLKIDTAGTDKVLRATASGFTSVDSSVFSIVAARAGASLAFATQPGGGAAGAAWAQQPVVHVQSGGSLDATATDTVTLTLTSGSGSLIGTRTANAVNGVATFSGLNMTTVGTKQITASAPGVSLVVSNNFNITAAAPASLSFATQPGGGAAGAVWTQQPVLQVFDAYSNLATTASGTVSLALNAGTGTLLGTTSATLSSGSVGFSDLKMNVSGTKKIRASLGSLYVDSGSFTVGSGTATKLAFQTQPGGGIAGVAWTNQPVLQALDAYDNRATSFAGTVAIALSAGTGALQGTLGIAASSGLASFTGIKTLVAGTGKKITATSSGLTSIESSAFDVVAGPAYRMVMVTAPATSGIANTNLSPQPKLSLEDQYNNPIISGVDAMAPITASIKTGTGSLYGSVTLPAASGVVTYTDLKVSEPGNKTFLFTKADTTGAGGTSSLFIESDVHNAIVGTPNKLAFKIQPGGGTAGIAWLQQPTVEILDIAGNLIPTGTNAVSLAVTTGTMGVLIGTTTQNGSLGTASFTNLRLNVSGPKTIRATSGTLAAATSGTFSVAHADAAEIVVGTMATSAVYNTNFSPATTVRVLDAYQNLVTTGPDASATITASLLTGTGTLGGSRSIAAASGVATFSTLRVNLIGPKTLKFDKEDLSIHDAAGPLSVTSGTINITHGAASKLIITTQPTGAAAGALLATQPVVEVRDAADNVVLTSSATVTAALGAGAPTGSVLSGTAAITAVSGVATFSSLSTNKAGNQTLRFTSGALTAANSTSFAITHGLASKMSLVTEPGNAVAATSFGTQPVLEILDSFDNRVTTGPDSSANVTASVASGTGNLSGSMTVASVAGLVTYSNLSVDAVGAKTLRFTKADTSGSGGTATLTKDSASFTVNPGAAAMLVMSQQPGGGVAGASWATPAEVAIQDANGYFVTTATDAVTASLATGSGVLSGTATVSAVAGVASFNDLSLNLIGTNKSLSFSSGAMIGATSNTFTITTAATDVASVVSATPTSLPGNGVATSTITAVLKDAYGNIASGRSVTAVSDRGATDTITGSPATSNASGEVTFTVKSGTSGTANITLTEGSVTLTTKPALTFSDAVPSATESQWSISKAFILNNGADSITLSMTIKNAAGDPLQDKTVSLTSSRGGSDTITGSPATSNASGQVSFTIRSSTLGSSKLTAVSDSVTLSDRIPVLVGPVSPVVDLRAGYATIDKFPIPGSNSASTSTWLDLLGNDNAVLTGFAYNTSSGWQGDGSGSILSGATGPYRVGLDGSDDRVHFNTALNSYSSFSAEMWIRPDSLTAKSTIFSSADNGSVRGVVLRMAGDSSNRLELMTGYRSSYAEVIQASSPTSYYRMNETSGATMRDSEGSTNGSYTGSPTYSLSAGLASNDRAIGFNGSSTYASLGSSLGSGNGVVSIEAWIYLDTNVSSAKAVVSKEDSNQGYTLEIENGNYVQMRAWATPLAGSATNYTATGSTALNTGTWYHVVGVRNTSLDCGGSSGMSVSVFLNGNLQDCTDFGTLPTVNSSAGNMWVGANPSTSSNHFPGRIDEVAIYSGTALSAASALSHYNAAAVPTCYSTSALTSSTWYHVVVGHDSSAQQLSLAVNGSEVCNVSSTASIGNSPAYMSLGAALDGSGSVRSGSAWAGAIGEFRFYTQRLTSTQAGQLYSAGSY